MSYTVERLADEPIVLITYQGDMDAESVLSAWKESLELGKDVSGILYRISDIRDANINFADGIGILKAVQQNPAGSTADSQIRGVFVGSILLAKVYADVMHRLGRDIPFFQTMEQALDYIHLKMQQE